MNEIACQAEHKKGQGCHTCGGYKVVLSQAPVCVKCNRVGWVRPGVHTSYVGKEWTSFDGIRTTQGPNGSVCDRCKE